MSDLHYINQISEIGKAVAKNNYTTDIHHVSSANLFIKALNKALEKINAAVAILPLIKHHNFKELAKNTENLTLFIEDAKLLVEFASHLELAGKIIDEFQKGTTILDENMKDFIDFFQSLYSAFSTVRLKITVFAIKKELKYAEEATSALRNIIDLFEKMKTSITPST